MPQARFIAEALFVLVVLTEPLAALETVARPAYRYFVLEVGADDAGYFRTVFCEWSEGSHLNYGDGCSPSAEAFIERVAQAL